MNRESEQRRDGRVQRSERTRERILRVMRDLIIEGDHAPTARQIAERANITPRTLFRHFPDMATLQDSLIESAEAGAARIMEEPFPEGSKDQWPERLEAIIDRRVRVYESLLPLYVSTIWAKQAKGLRDQGIERRRERLRTVLSEDMLSDAILFEAIDGVLSLEFWASLRRDQRLDVSRSSAVVRLVVERLTGTGAKASG